jgi:hypothetical protein
VGAGEKDIFLGNPQLAREPPPDRVGKRHRETQQIADDEELGPLSVPEEEGPRLEVVEDPVRPPVEIEPETRQVGAERGADGLVAVSGLECHGLFPP